MSSAICFNLDKSKILSSGNGLIQESYPSKEGVTTVTPALQRQSFDFKSVMSSSLFSMTWVNPIPNHEILDWSNLKAFADNKIKVTEKLEIVWGKAENTVGKGEHAVYQHFLVFPQCFQKVSYTAFPRFPTMFSKGFLYRVIKSCHSVVKN